MISEWNSVLHSHSEEIVTDAEVFEALESSAMARYPFLDEFLRKTAELEIVEEKEKRSCQTLVKKSLENPAGMQSLSANMRYGLVLSRTRFEAASAEIQHLRALAPVVWVKTKLRKRLAKTGASLRSSETVAKFLKALRELVREFNRNLPAGATEERVLLPAEMLMIANVRPVSVTVLLQLLESGAEVRAPQRASARETAKNVCVSVYVCMCVLRRDS